MHNEQGNVRALYDDIKGVMEALEQSYEIIFVNDASTDHTLATMREIQECDADFHFADLETNVGENWALLAGISKAQGEVIVTIDGDYQNDPAYIPDLLQALAKGYRVVSGRREQRAEPAPRPGERCEMCAVPIASRASKSNSIAACAKVF